MPRLIPDVVPPGRFGAGDQPALEGGDLRLRPWEAGDAGVLQRAYDDADIRRWHCARLDDDEAAGYAQEWAQGWTSATRVGWAVVRQDSVVGRVTLTHLDLAGGQAEVTYWTLPEARRTGVAARAVELVCGWAFGIGLNRLELEHSTENAASCAVAEKAGFALEGTRHRAALHLDGWHDMHLHARLS